MHPLPVLSQGLADESALDPVEAPVEDPVEPSMEDIGAEASDPADLEEIQEEVNPLNPVGDSLDRLIQLRMNDDLWMAMLGDLPCLEATETCLMQLQELAISHSLALQAIDERVELVNQKIDEARANNQATIRLGVFEPAVTAFFQIQEIPEVRNAQGQVVQPRQRRGFLDRIFQFLDEPLRGINDALALIGVPLFKNAIGGDAATQQREIAIADLQVKVAEIENQRGEIAQNLREQVILQVLNFDQIRRDFQVSQEVAKRDLLRMQVLEMDYRFNTGTIDTPQYLSQLSRLDQQKADVFRGWAQLRSQLVRVKTLVLGVER
jgi:hypothetical protein